MNDFYDTFKTIADLEHELISDGASVCDLLTKKIQYMTEYKRKLEFAINYTNYLIKELSKR